MGAVQVKEATQTPDARSASGDCALNQANKKVGPPLFRGPDDGVDRLSRKAKRHQGLRRTRQAVLYQTLCRPAFERKQASDVAFPPSFGGCGVSRRTTPICAIALFRVNRLLAQERRPERLPPDAHLLAQAVTARWRAANPMIVASAPRTFSLLAPTRSRSS